MSQVGSAYASLGLDISGLKQGVEQAKIEYSGLQQSGASTFQSLAEYMAQWEAAGKQSSEQVGAGLEQEANKAVALAQNYARLQQTQGDYVGAARTLREALDTEGAATEKLIQVEIQLEQVQQRAAQGALQQAQAEARLAIEERDTATAVQSLRNAIEAQEATLGKTTQGTVALTNAKRQLTQIENQANGEIGKLEAGLNGLQSIAGGLTTALGGLGIAFGVQQIGQFTIESAKGAAQLKDTENALRQISGSQQVYNTILDAAQRQQRAFGGSLQQNLAELQSFAVVSRTTGADLNELIRTAQRLAALNSEQGVSGAKIGLVEGLSGQTRSLQTRFNIPANEIAKLRDTSTSAAEKLQILNQYLDKAGISANGAADSISKETRSFNAFGVAVDNVKNKFGEFLNRGLAPAAQGAADFLNSFNGGRESFVSGAVALGSFVRQMQGLPPLSEAAAQAQRDHGNAILAFLGIQSETVGVNNQAAVASANAAQMERDHQAAMQFSVTALREKAQADIDAATAGKLYLDNEGQVIAATQESADKTTLDTQAKQLYTAQMELLQGKTKAAADSFLALNPNITGSGLASAVASGQISTAVAQYIAMTLATAKARAELAALQRQAGVEAALAGKATTDSKTTARQEASDRRDQRAEQTKQSEARVAEYKAEQAAAKKRADDELQAQIIMARARGDTKREIELLRQQEQALGNDVLGRARIEAQILELEKPKKERGGAKLSDQQKLNNQLAAGQDKLNDTLENNQIKADEQAEDAAAKHARKLLDIEQEYERKSLEQQRRNEVDKRRSRFDFYKSLTEASKDLDPETTQRLSAEYEADFQKAQELAQQGKAKESQEFLALKRQQRQDEIQYERDLAEARKALKDAGSDEERRDAEARIEQLQRLRKLQEDAQNEEEKQLLENGDDLQNEKQKQIDQESESYAVSRDKIATAAERADARAARSAEQAADRQIASAERAGKKIDENSLKVDRLGKGYDKIAQPSTRDRLNAADAQKAERAAAGDTPAATTADRLDVRDADVLTAITSQTEALAQQLGNLVSATDEVRRAVKSLRDRDGTI